MNRPLKAVREFYTEAEAAAELKISVERLHNLLDRKLFNDGSSRPPTVSFQSTDLILLRFWLDQDQPRLIQMPPRKLAQAPGAADPETDR
jgi:hypothetical protein